MGAQRWIIASAAISLAISAGCGSTQQSTGSSLEVAGVTDPAIPASSSAGAAGTAIRSATITDGKRDGPSTLDVVSASVVTKRRTVTIRVVFARPVRAVDTVGGLAVSASFYKDKNLDSDPYGLQAYMEWDRPPSKPRFTWGSGDPDAHHRRVAGTVKGKVVTMIVKGVDPTVLRYVQITSEDPSTPPKVDAAPNDAGDTPGLTEIN